MKKNDFEIGLFALLVTALAPGLLAVSLATLLFRFSGMQFDFKAIFVIFIAGLLLTAYQAKTLEVAVSKWVFNKIINAACQAAVIYSLLLPIKYYKERNVSLLDIVVIFVALIVWYKSNASTRKLKTKKITITEWWKRETGRVNWHALKIFLVPISIFLTWLFYLPIAFFYDLINPIHSGAGPFSYTGGIKVVGLQVVIGVALFVPATFLACISMNLIYWCIPPARRAFATDAAHNPSRSLKANTEELLIYLKRYLLIGYIVAILGTIAFRLI